MATPAPTEALRLGGNLGFFSGGMSVDYLIGAFIKSAEFANGVWTLTFQNASGVEDTVDLSPGWTVAATAPANPYKGQGWYDTTADTLKIYDGSLFESLTGTLLADGSVSTSKIADLAVTTAKLAAGAISAAKMAVDSVDVDALVDVSVTTAKLAADSVTKEKIADNAVEAAAIKDGAVGTAALADSSVSSAKLQLVSVSSPYIGEGAVTATKIGAGAVQEAKINASAVTTAKLHDDAVTPPKIDADNETKQDLFLTRLNALRRDLDNIATLSASEQRTALSGLGAFLEGGRPIPSADYAGRVWIDGTNDQAHICRNDPEYTTAVQGGFYGATIPSTVQVGEYVEDLTAPLIASEWAYTYGDNHFWVGTSGTGTAFYFGQTDEHTVLGQLATSGNVGEWLGQSDWDGEAQTRLPTDALPANRDYFFWNNRTRSIRQFNRANYSPAGSPLDHWKWEPVTTIAANISIFDARDGNLPSLPIDGTKNSWIGVSNDGLWFVEKRAEFTAAGSVGSWANWTHTSSSPTRVYKGAFNGDTPESVSGATLGDFYYNHRDRTWRSYQVVDFISIPGGIWGEMHSTDSGWPPSFIGDFGNQTDAISSAHLHDIQPGASFTAYTGTHVQQASTYAVPQGANYSVHWRFLPVNHLSSGDVSASDDYVSGLAFTETAGVIALVATMHGGSIVTATGATLLAPLVAPTFTGEAKAVTAAVGTDSTQIATTAFVAAEIANQGAAPLASPNFTGTPTVPALETTDGDTQIATKKYVDDNAGTLADGDVTKDKLATDAVTTVKIKDGNVTTVKLADDSVTPAKLDSTGTTKQELLRAEIAAAPLNNPVFTGVPQAPHPMANGLVAQIATVRYVNEQAGGGGLGDATALISHAQGADFTFATPELFTLTETLVKGKLLEFVIQDGQSGSTNNIRSVGYIMSDLILSLTVPSGTLTQASTSLDRVVLKIHEDGDIGYAHDSISIWRGTVDNKLYLSSGRSNNCRIQINSYDLTSAGGGGATGAGGAAGSSTTVNTRRLQLILHQWGATQPADPTQVWESSGWTGTIDGDATSSWVEDEPTTTPAGTHWIALANAYSGDDGSTWTQYPWSVFSVGAGYLAEQYSEDASSWHATRTDYDFWMRLRRPDGTWTGSIALKAVPWQPILDWADVYRPNYQANATVAWKFNINEVDLLTYNDLVLEARFFYYINGPPDHFSAVARTSIPLGTVNKDGLLASRHATSPTVLTPSTDLRWQTIPQDFVLADWTSPFADREARRQGVYRAVLDRDNGLSVVLGEGARSTPDDASYQRATICFGLQTAAIGAYNSTINAIAIHVPVGTQAYSRTQIRILGR